MDTNIQGKVGQKWDFELLEFWYRSLLNPNDQHKYYDAELHYRSVESLLSKIDKSPSTNPLDKLSAEYLESAFTSPDSLAEALLNFDLSRLINGYWPNVNSGFRSIPVSVEEWFQNSQVDLPNDDDGLRIDARKFIGEEWYIPPIIGCTLDEFLAKSLDLIERETSRDGLSDWPLCLLALSGALQDPWRAWGAQVHEENDKYPIYSHDLFMDILNKCIEKDDSDWKSISSYSFQMRKAALEFSEGQRISGFTTLEKSFDAFSHNEWTLGFLDHQIQSSSLKRADLSIDEWLQMFKLSVLSLENVRTSNESYGVLSPDSSRGLYCPVITDDYWAWRTGWVIASGLHLKDEIMDLAFRRNFHSYIAEDNSIDLIQNVPSSIAIDLMQTFDQVSDWKVIEREMTAVYLSISTGEFRVYDGGSYFTNHGDDKRQWLIKLGFIWYMRSQSSLRSTNELPEKDGVLGSLDRQWNESGEERDNTLIDLAVSRAIAAQNEQLYIAISSKITAQNNQERFTGQTVSYEYLSELIGKQLFTAITPDAKWELQRAESYFQNWEDNDSGWAAGQHYANFIEGLANSWLGPLWEALYLRMGITRLDRPPKPGYLGKWSLSLVKDVLPLVNPIIDISAFWPRFDRMQVEILADRMSYLNKARSEAHSGISPMMANKARDLALGEFEEESEPGILQILAKLAGKV